VKGKHVALIIAAIIIADQALKFYIKLNFHYQESRQVLGNWFYLDFVENEGMAWGWQFGGSWGKMFLTLFRLVAVVWGVFLLKDFIQKKYHKGFIICAALIFSGALGNLLDSMFYGLIFEGSNLFTYNVAKLSAFGHGYAGFLHGRVVDMLYFPLFNGTFPSWFPVWGGEPFIFFSPVFNIADASISVGVFILLIFQNKFFKNAQGQKPVVANTADEVKE
jgi:Lipoprotein signal peptidase